MKGMDADPIERRKRRLIEFEFAGLLLLCLAGIAAAADFAIGSFG